jgi:hypothetical protein
VDGLTFGGNIIETGTDSFRLAQTGPKTTPTPPTMPASDRRRSPTTVGTDELARIAELLAIIDGFLRSRPVPELLAEHLHDIGVDHPGYDAALLIEQVSFTAHALRAYRRPTDEG